MRRLAFIAPSAIIVSFAVLAAAAGKFKATGEGHSTFSAVGPMGLSINGTAGKPRISEENGNLVIKVGLGQIKTGIEARDKEARKVFAKLPDASFSVPLDKVKLNEPGKTLSGKMTGKFHLNGLSKEGVTVSYTVKDSDGGKVVVNGSGTINYTDYGIDKQCLMKTSVCVDPPVSFKVEFKLAR
jgi:polyisoprenoid-binding protein YceI